jgi:hypothetical protein
MTDDGCQKSAESDLFFHSQIVQVHIEIAHIGVEACSSAA